MTMQGLDEIQHRFAGPGAQARAGATLEITLGNIERHLAAAREGDLNNGRAAQPIKIPAVQYPVVAGSLTQPTAQILLGPEDGQNWHVTRITVQGLAANSASVNGSGSQTTPGSHVTIASVALGPGTWMLMWDTGLEGTPGATDANNFQLVAAGSTITGINPGTTGGPWAQQSIQITTTTSITPVVRSNAAATAGAIYTAQLIAVPSGGDTIGLYRELGLGPGANGNTGNLLWQFTAASPVWEPKGLYLRSPDQLLLAGGPGLITAGPVTLAGEAVAVEDRWLTRYLL